MWKAAAGRGFSFCFGMIDRRYIDDRLWLSRFVTGMSSAMMADMDRRGTIRKTKRVTANAAAVIGVIALGFMGQRLAPPQMAPAGGGIGKKACDVDAPPPLHAAAKRWCADGL